MVAATGIEAPALSSAGLAPEMVAGVAAQLEMVLGAARPGGLSGVSSEQALQVVEAVEAVKAWAEAISVDATAVMVTEFERDFADLEPEAPSAWEIRRFRRSCRSAAAREIQVATGLPITQCQRRVWFSGCEPERVGPVRGLLRLGRVTLARAMALTEATAHLDARTASVIATRVLRPLTGPDGEPLAGVAPLSQATFNARLHRQLVLHNGVVGEAERTHEEAVKARRLTAEPQRDGTGALVITGDGPGHGSPPRSAGSTRSPDVCVRTATRAPLTSCEPTWPPTCSCAGGSRTTRPSPRSVSHRWPWSSSS
jgi:hypothetical protein